MPSMKMSDTTQRKRARKAAIRSLRRDADTPGSRPTKLADALDRIERLERVVAALLDERRG